MLIFFLQVVVHKSKATAHEKDEAKKGVSEALKVCIS